MFEINKSNFNSKKAFKIKNKRYFLTKINLKLYVDDEYLSFLKKFLSNSNELVTKLKRQYDRINDLYDIRT